MAQRANFIKWTLLIVAMSVGVVLWPLAEIQAQVVSEPPANTGEDLKKALQSSKPVLVDFGANKCIPCRQIRPILREIGKEYAGKAHVLIIDV